MIILAFILLVLVGAISFLNAELMSISLYFTTLTVPAWIIFIGFLLIGMLIAALFATSKGARNRQIIKNKDQEIEHAQEEKEEAIRRIQQEKEEAVERTKKESDLQLALQNREARIQNLEAQLAQDHDETNEMKSAHIQQEPRDHSIPEQDRDQLVADEQITTYKIDSSNDDNYTD